MSNKPEDVKQEGINVDQVTFDQNGEIVGLSDDVLDNVAGGLRAVEENNKGCGNSVNGSC